MNAELTAVFGVFGCHY